MKIRVGYIMSVKFEEKEDNTSNVTRRRTSKEVVVYIQDMAGKKKFCVKFKDEQRVGIDNHFLSLISTKDEVGQGVKDIIYSLIKKVKMDC